MATLKAVKPKKSNRDLRMAAFGRELAMPRNARIPNGTLM